LGMNGLGFSHNHIEKLQELNKASFQRLSSSIQAKTMHDSDKNILKAKTMPSMKQFYVTNILKAKKYTISRP